MPEGHTVHRTAKQFQKLFGGKPVTITSPQGRFTDASLISGQQLKRAEAWGKQMLLHFETAAIRIHLGIYGKWKFQSFEDQAPEPYGQVRARFLAENQLVDLRGPTACELTDFQELPKLFLRLGPDPLRPDPKGEAKARFIETITKRRVAIGALLMDQSVIAGIGNVYRAELLFRARQNPHTPGNLVPGEVVAGIWDDAVNLMPIGVRTGLMLTREGFL